MRIKFYRCIIVLLISFLTACTAPVGVSPASATPAKTEPTAPVAIVFTDPALEAMVRGSMGKPTGDITVAEAESVTQLNLSNEWQRYISEEMTIHNIDGLEFFKNLESLDLSFHAVTNITPLSGLKKLTSLSLRGSPINDIAPLAGLTSLKVLTLSGCAAQDYSPLAMLVNLNFLMLDNASITDVSPLVSLTNLKYLYLAGCPISNYFPLSDIYQSLEQKDFIIAFTLDELGFIMDNDGKQAIYDGDRASMRINHIEWGAPPEDWKKDCILTDFEQNDHTILIGYYPSSDAYVIMANKDGNQVMNYVYDHANDIFFLNDKDRDSLEQLVRAIFTDTDAEDVLLTPIQTSHGIIIEMLGVSADTLFELPFDETDALPFGQLTLKDLGFVPDEANAVCLYEQREGIIMNLEVHRPEWGEKEYDFRFYTPINDYGLVITYHMNEQRFQVSSDLGETYAVFYYFLKDGSTVDGVVSGAATVKEYFQNMYNDPEITDIYSYSVRLVEQYISDAFGLSIDELCTLPVGE